MAGDGSLCGEILTVEGQAQSGGHTWHGFAQTVVGLGDAYLQRFDAGAGYWGVDLDETDTAFDDSWQWGVPQQYLYSGFYTLQPNGGNDGACWFTGLAAGNFRTGDYHGLGMGRATLRSPPIDLSSAISPSVRYQAWFIALDVSDPLAPPVVADEDHLILEATNDGIAWAKVDQVDGEDDRWRPRNVPLTGVRLDQPVQFRFTVNRGDPDHPAPDELVEAGVDDFEVVTDLPSCVGRPDTPDMGTQAVTPFPGCTIGRGQGMGMGWPLLVFFGIVIFRGASRRPRSPACRPSREGSGGAFPRR